MTEKGTGPEQSANERQDGFSNGRNRDGRFAPGATPGPGRPAGARSKIARLLDETVSGDDAREILAAQITAAKAGDSKAASLIFDRLWPVPRGRMVDFKLPEGIDPKDMPAVAVAIFTAVCGGELTPDEAKDLGSVLEGQRKAIEISEILPLLRELEAAQKANRK